MMNGSGVWIPNIVSHTFRSSNACLRRSAYRRHVKETSYRLWSATKRICLVGNRSLSSWKHPSTIRIHDRHKDIVAKRMSPRWHGHPRAKHTHVSLMGSVTWAFEWGIKSVIASVNKMPHLPTELTLNSRLENLPRYCPQVKLEARRYTGVWSPSVAPKSWWVAR